MFSRRASTVLLAVIGLLTACGSEGPATTTGRATTSTTTAPTTAATTAPVTSAPGTSAPATSAPATSAPATSAPTTEPPQGPFVSSHYGYTLASDDWTGTDARKRWDGAGAPGDGSPTVDTLEGPQGVRAFAVAIETEQPLEEFVTAFRKANSKVHSCPTTPEATDSITIGGAPAIMDQMHCPPPTGAYTITATTYHDGTEYVFFTYTTVPGAERFTRRWFNRFLPLISFEV